jgi:hypothetical protein
MMKLRLLTFNNLTSLAQTVFACVFGILIANIAAAEVRFSVEGLTFWQSLNEVKIPGNTGTKFSLAEFEKGAVLGGRIYAGYRFNKHHEFRALYAPFLLERSGRFDQTVNFEGKSFAAGVETETIYKFNSYRLTYAYHFDLGVDPSENWQWALGFTAKVRDAEISLRQGVNQAKKTDLGFVPLLHVQGLRKLSRLWAFRLDFDGLVAPQGRALDLSLYLERNLWHAEPNQNIHGAIGYRTLEGGADNETVYNFAWLHALVFGLRGEF